MRLVRPKEEVCKERATIATNEKYDPIISEKRKQYAASRNPKIMQEIIKLSRKKTDYWQKAYEEFLKNYVKASDSISRKVPDKIKKSYGLKEFTNYLSDALDNI